MIFFLIIMGPYGSENFKVLFIPQFFDKYNETFVEFCLICVPSQNFTF